MHNASLGELEVTVHGMLSYHQPFFVTFAAAGHACFEFLLCWVVLKHESLLMSGGMLIAYV